MLYLNQLEYESIPYPTDIRHPGSDFAGHGNIRRAGCGSKAGSYMRRLTFRGKIQRIAVLHIAYFPDSHFR